jgi:GTP-binding protein
MTPTDFDADALASGEALFKRPFTFLKTVPSLDWLPVADRPEITFAGRSNVGKSSLINALCRVRGLARTSNTPGRTQDLNFFETTVTPVYLVDMPGYGYAEAPKEKVEAWTKFIKAYLSGRPSLRRVYLLIDARHGVKAVDREIMALLTEAAVTFEIVLTKVDKLNAHAVAKMEETLCAIIDNEPAAFPRFVSTSSQTGQGIDILRGEIAEAIGFTAPTL